MTALSADIDLKKSYPGASPDAPVCQEFEVSGSVTIYKNSAIGLNLTSGYVRTYDDQESDVYIGLASEGVDNSSGSDGDKTVNVEFNEMIKVHQVTVTGASSQANVGDPIYFVDDNVNALTTSQPGSDTAVGRIAKWYSSTTCDVILTNLY